MSHVPELGQLNPHRARAALGRAVKGQRTDVLAYRMGTVITATSVTDYVVALSGDGVNRSMGCVAPVAPIVGSVVRVMQLGPSYLITDVVGGKVGQSGKLNGTFTAVAVHTVVQVFPVPYLTSPDLNLTVQSATSLCTEISAISATQFTARTFTPGGGVVSLGYVVNWTSFGV